MWFYLKLTAIVLILSLLTCGASIGLARAQTQENPLTKLGISRCDKDLCIQTIRPGKTLWANSLTILRGQPHVTVLEDVINFNEHNMIKSYYQGYGGVTVVSLRSSPQEQLMTAGELIQYFGIPCSVHMYTNWMPVTIFLNYPEFAAEIVTQQDKLYITLETPITGLYLSGLSTDCNGIDNVGYMIDKETWCGFTSFERLFEHCKERKAPE